MARIPLINRPEKMSPAQREVYEAVVSGPRGRVEGPLMAALHNPVLADRWQKLGAELRYNTSLPRAVNEIAILVTARFWDCELEWALHERAAVSAGVTERDLEEVRSGGVAVSSVELRDASAFALELLSKRRVGQGAYEQVLVRWGDVGAVELTAVIGYYSMVALTLNAHEIPLPAGVTSKQHRERTGASRNAD